MMLILMLIFNARYATILYANVSINVILSIKKHESDIFSVLLYYVLFNAWCYSKFYIWFMYYLLSFETCKNKLLFFKMACYNVIEKLNNKIWYMLCFFVKFDEVFNYKVFFTLKC